MRKDLQRRYYLRREVSGKNDYGEYVREYGEAREIRMDIQPVSAKLQAEMYGLRVNNIRVCYTDERDIKEGDGICVEVGGDEEPDFIVIGVKKWNTHTVVDIERRRGYGGEWN